MTTPISLSNKLCIYALTPLVCMVGISATAQDQLGNDATILQAQLIEDIGAAERLEAVDVMRTISQESAAAACHLSNGVAADEARTHLEYAHEKFGVMLDALYHGNDALNIIGTETDRRTLLSLDVVRDGWVAIDAAIVTLLSDPSDGDAIALIKAQNEALLEQTNVLMGQMAGVYANPAELLQADAILLDVAGRQSMMLEKIAKEACEVWTGNLSDDRLAALKQSADMFEFAINALYDGMPTAGIAAAPTPEIEFGLEILMADWDVARVSIDAILGGDSLSVEDRAALYHILNEKKAKMEGIVHNYTIYSKHKFDHVPEI